MRVLITRRLHEFAMRDLQEEFSVTVNSEEAPMPRDELVSKIRDVEGIVCFPYDSIDREVIDAAPNLRAISTYSVGFDHIDVEYAKRRKIRIGYTPDVLTDATAELAMALMLDVMRRVTEGDRAIRGGRWTRVYGALDHLGAGLSGRTLGILGLGRIGGAVARRAAAFGMRITYHGRSRADDAREAELGARYVEFEDLVAQSDVLSIHVPHTAETDGLVDLAVLSRMKRTSFLINTARGRIVSESDLVLALRQGIIAGAGLDVFESEPIGGDHPLCGLDNVVLAPHIGSSAAATRERMARIAVRNLRLAMAGKSPAYSV